MASHINASHHLFVLIPALVGLVSLVLYWPSVLSLVPMLGPKLLSSTNPYVDVTNPRTSVSYRGTSVNDVEHFQNIFYAEDTAGANRFSPPVSYMPPAGTVVDATAPGAICPQGLGPAPLPFASPTTNVSENCLSLRIARPARTRPLAKLPVMVLIHGGGNALGTASDQLYRPDGLVRQAKANGHSIIFVGINYRLGIFGYAISTALRDAKQGNAGLRDQRAAFEWIRDNIEAFGGDPNNVIAIGQSVGASSIGLHLISYRGKRRVPFQKAIMMSGATGLNFNIMSDLVANNTAIVARSVGCTKGNPDSKATLACLRGTSFERLMNVSVTLSRQNRPPFGELFFYPSFDGDYIPESPSEMLRRGEFVKDIPIIASWVTNDGAWYAPPSTSSDSDVLASFTTFILGLSEPSLKKLLSLYPVSDFTHQVRPDQEATAQYYRAARMNRDLWFTCPVIDFTFQYFKHGGSGGSSFPNVRMYEMNQTKFTPIFNYMGVPHWRVSHLSDIPYILNNDIAGGGDNSPSQQELSRLVSGSAAAFAWTGDPTNSDGKVLMQDWPSAYEGLSKTAFEKGYAEGMNLYVIGGPYGNGVARVSGSGSSSSSGQREDALEREKAVEAEKVLERCAFINSIREEIGV